MSSDFLENGKIPAKNVFYLKIFTVQSATSSLSGFQLTAFALPIEVDNCCKITVSKSERERFISDFGLSLSLAPNQKKFKFMRN